MGVHNTVQARRIDGVTRRALAVSAAKGALADAGIALRDVDGVAAAQLTLPLIYDLRVGPAWYGAQPGLGMVLEAVAAVDAGLADVVLVVSADVGAYVDRAATAPWTQPNSRFLDAWGVFTAAEFALVARRHMIEYGTTERQLACVAATIRNNGHVNPDAVYYGRGPFTPEDILASRMIADPFRLLDCSMASEGGCALVIVAPDRVAGARRAPVHLLAAGVDAFGPAYRYPPSWDLRGRPDEPVNGWVGKRAAERAFRRSGLSPGAVDVLELYDPFSFEVIRQLEAFGFCKPGEGGPYVEDGGIEHGGPTPVTTDGGLLSYSHAGAHSQILQRVVRSVEQLRGTARTMQVPGAEVALCSSGGPGALFCGVAILGKEPP